MAQPHSNDVGRDDSSRLLPVLDTPDQRILDDSWFDLPALGDVEQSPVHGDDIALDDPWFR